MNMEGVLADIDADDGKGSGTVWDMVCSLSLAPLASLSLAGQEHGRTIPLSDARLLTTEVQIGLLMRSI
jgi:hypothetical protein